MRRFLRLWPWFAGSVLVAGIILLVFNRSTLERAGFDLTIWPEWSLFGKTLWDWMDLVFVSAVLAFGVWFLNKNLRENEERRTEELQREEVLHKFLDKMSELLLDKELVKKKVSENDPVLDVAKVRTTTALRALGPDRARKDLLLQFLKDSNLADWMLVGASLAEADLKLVNLNTINLRTSDLESADLRDSRLWKTNLEKANLERANLLNAELPDANLEGARLMEANLKKANLVRANLERTYLYRAILRKAHLFGANLWKANLSNADLRGAYLEGARLEGAKLWEANLRGANLRRADLRGADLRGAKLRGATMPDGTKYSKSTDLAKFTEPP